MFDLVRKLLGRNKPPAQLAPSDVDFKALAENSNDVIIRCGPDAVACYVSPSSLQLFGRSPEEMIGKSHLAYVLPEDMPALAAAAARHAAGNESGLVAFRVRRKDGTVVWVEGSGRSISDPKTGEMGLVIVMRDITDRKELERQLAEMAATDGLTGLANRRAFDSHLETEWQRSKRAQNCMSLLLLDIDHFKTFNDHYGHQVGDDCLRAVASMIQAQVRRTGYLAARYGGEEFAVILPQTASSVAVEIAESIRTAVEALGIPHAKNLEGGGTCTISAGAATALSTTGGSVQMPAALLQAADTALYKAKQQGRNRTETALLLTFDKGATSATAA